VIVAVLTCISIVIFGCAVYYLCLSVSVYYKLSIILCYYGFRPDTNEEKDE